MRRLFVDTGAWYALIVPADARHAHARRVIEEAAAMNADIVTTNSVVLETYALLLTRPEAGRTRAIALLDTLDTGAVTVERVTAVDEARAPALVRAHADKRYSLCDAQGFVVMERLGVREALSYDGHFRAYFTDASVTVGGDVWVRDGTLVR